MPRLSALVFALVAAACGGVSTPPPQHGTGTSGAIDGGDLPTRDAQIGINAGQFVDNDPTNDTGSHVHRWRITLTPTQRVRIRMRSPNLDPVMTVRGPDGFVAHNDDGLPGLLDALVEFVPPQAGAYEVLATTFSASQTGDYQLEITPRSLEGVGLAHQLGRQTDSELGAHGQSDLPGSWLHFEGQGGAIVTLRVTSQSFDTIATLIGPGGETWVNDDANDLGADGNERAVDSTIVAALPASGVYQLVVTPYGGRGGGAFRVRSEVRPPITLDGNGSRPLGLAGANGGGRVWGIYAGISAYVDQNQLYGCADDARMLAEAMRVAHIQDESDQLVLPDGLATRAAFQEAVAQIAHNAGPNDVVVVFFSGHGNQVPDDNGDEIDGLDETIVFYDGPMRDDEVVEALSALRSNNIILALDSCHSGGFADDWVRRPNRMGLFSSDEDVLSDTAEPHRAGGYLSWHLRRGVLGEADTRPRDGVLHAGELTDYINDGFVADHRRMNPEGGHEPAQRLVVRRGAVNWGQVLWVYPRNRDLSLPPLPDIPLTSARP